MQPPRRIDNENIGALFFRRRQRVVGEAGGVGIGRRRHHRRAGPIAPDFELLDRGGAERVARRQDDAFALVAKQLGELADGGGLAAAIGADHQNDGRLVGGVERESLFHRQKEGLDDLSQGGADFVGGDFLVELGVTQARRRLFRQAPAEIGGDQQFLQLRQRLVVEPPLGENAGDAAADLGRGARQAGAQPPE